MQKLYTLTLAGKFILPVAIGGVLLILLVVAGLILVQEQNTERAGLNTAQSLAHQITTLRTVYTTQVLSRAKEAGLEAPYDFESRENTLPETFIRALGEQMAEDFPGMSVRLYSRNPDRVAQEPYDAFERYAIEELENDAETPVYRIEEVNGRRSMRYAIADVIGDVRGVVEVIVPLDDLDAGLQASSIQLGLGILAGVLLLMVMVLLVLRRAVIQPVAALRDAAQAVSTGDLDTEIEVRSADEVGGLARLFNEMMATIRETTQALQVEKLCAQEALTQAEQARRSSEQEKQYLAGSIDYMLEQIGRFAEGNLTVRLDADRDDEVRKLAERTT